MRSYFVKALISRRGEGRHVIDRRSQLHGLRFVTGLILFVLPFLLAPLASAQDSAAIFGTVTDPSGAIVAGANVTVVNVDTGTARDVLTDNTGRYRVVSLAVGPYEVHVKQSGFSEEIRTGIHLVVGQEAEIDLALRLGQATERITVNEDAPPVSVTNADISGLVGEQQVKDLPLNGRSFDAVDDFESRRGQFYLGENGRFGRRLQLHYGEYVFGFGQPAPAESVLAQRY